jgi:hypothetical protein
MTHKFFDYCKLPTSDIATYKWEFKTLTQIANRASYHDPDLKPFLKQHLHDLRGGYEDGNNYKPVIFALYDPEVNDCPKLQDWFNDATRYDVKLVGCLMYHDVTHKVITYDAGLGQRICRFVLHDTPSQSGQEMFVIALPQK